MNNRAIIALEIRNGYFSLWSWVNGSPEDIGAYLYKYFRTDEEVTELLSYKSIFGIYIDPSEDKHKKVAGKFARLSNGLYVKYDDGYDKNVAGGFNGFFRSLQDMLAQDISYLYAFRDGMWHSYIKSAQRIQYINDD